MTPTEQFLKLLTRVEQISSPEEFFAFARQQKFDGSVTFHFQGGSPKRVEVGRPIHIEIVPLPTYHPGADQDGGFFRADGKSISPLTRTG